jgi:6-pyruvoyl-tetrahydropterin synthase
MHVLCNSARGFALVQIAHDGYVIDFGDIKKITRKLCKELNEHFLCPQRSDVIDVQVADGQVTLQCQDGAKFSFPEVRQSATLVTSDCHVVGLDVPCIRSNYMYASLRMPLHFRQTALATTR